MLGGHLVGLLVTLFLASVLIYGALYVVPGGGPIGALTGGHSITHHELLVLDAEYHLNQSFFLQYIHWLGHALTGNLGQSIVYHESVASLVIPRLLTSLTLVGYAAVLIVGGGFGLGLLAAVKPRRLGVLITTVTSVGLAIPSFVAAVLLIAVFSVDLGWFPVFGAGAGVLGRLWHMTLPAIALAIANTAYIAQITNAEARSQLRREHVQTAIVRGIPFRLIVRRHVVRNALIPVVTVSGIMIASLFALDAVVEEAFGINGVGAYLVQAIQQKDFAVVQAIALLMVSIFVVINAIVDAIYLLLDPRIGNPVST